MVSDKSTVIVKPNAYFKMLVHVLRFGSNVKSKNEYREVMGILIGHLEGDGVIKDVVVEEAIPISHGGSIEVAFAPEDYITFSMVNCHIGPVYVCAVRYLAWLFLQKCTSMNEKIITLPLVLLKRLLHQIDAISFFYKVMEPVCGVKNNPFYIHPFC